MCVWKMIDDVLDKINCMMMMIGNCYSVKSASDNSFQCVLFHSFLVDIIAKNIMAYCRDGADICITDKGCYRQGSCNFNR